jgi:hypothetical protein
MKSIAFAALAAALSQTAHADSYEELDKFLEANAISAAYAQMCDEEPISDQLKSSTMMLLAVSGLQPHNVQLGSAKWREVMRRQFALTKNASSVDCAERVPEAKARLSETQHIIEATRKP